MTIVKPMPVGPQIGAPPSLEQVPIARLQVDAAYQRATDGPASRKIITGMVARWDWHLCQPLVISRRADGGLFILDGQHRHAGATARGDIPFLPCVLLSSLDQVDEASTFINLNTRRQRLTQSDIFHGQLATGDPDARRVQELLEDTGWTAKRHNCTSSFNAGDLNCAPMLVKRLATDGAEALRFALTALRQAWPETAVRSGSTFVKALLQLANEASLPDAETLSALLGNQTENDWLLQADNARRGNRHLSRADALARTILRASEGDSAAPPTATAPALPPGTVMARVVGQPIAQPKASPATGFASANRSLFNLEGGQAWCSQCEQRRTRDNAASCKDQFCKLKGAL